ncbi:hypothetical protein LTR36_002717 [Oleoguttula mirabilis]|uniref:Uncharacterized protein n=1 Tax=Oleoguttula mirabilis TaxID=1507867 RepID=A0AAV9JLA2_9PEZI|nr:hypothetical protein LTR36_002717 [Oleoguttula mirabilis]
MDKQTDGPQAATRHAKDRRPTWKSKAARSLSAVEQVIEQRLARLEGKQAASPPSPKTSAALDLDTDLDTFGHLFNDLEERVAALEKLEPQSELETRLSGVIDARIKPYEQYRTEATNAVQQLKEVRESMRPVALAKPNVETMTLVNDHEASLREFSGRLLHLEDQTELTKAQSLSTSDLAKALLHRLKRGDILAQGPSRDIRLALDGAVDDGPEEATAPPPRMPDTPVTDMTGARQSVVEESVEDDDDDSPKKRRRTARTPRAAKFEGRRRETEPISTPQCESALSAFRSGGLAVDYEGTADDAGNDVDDMEGVIIPPEVRRTSRKPVPTKQHEDMVHWKEANLRLRGSG